MKKICFLLILLIFSCQKASDQTKTAPPKTTGQNGAPTASLKVASQNLTCEQYFQDLVNSSNLPALKNYKDVFVRIENRSSTKITLELYVVNNVSEKIGEVRNTERTVSFLEFYPTSKQLFDITSDPDEPLEVSYDTKRFVKLDFDKICKSNDIAENKPISQFTKTDCKKINGEMISGEECRILNTDIKAVYLDLIKNKLIDDTEFLEKNLPAKNLKKEINKNGLLFINYNINKKNNIVTLRYDGGETSVELETSGDNVVRKIKHSAD